MTAFLEAIGLKWLTLIAGFLGAVVSLKFIDGLSAKQRASTVQACSGSRPIRSTARVGYGPNSGKKRTSSSL